MLLQTNSYLVPKDKRAEHARLVRRFRQLMQRYGCENFEVYEQIGADWNAAKVTGRFVQMMRFRDRQQHLDVQDAERRAPAAQELIEEFCQLLNIPYQREQGLFAVGFYQSALPAEGGRSAVTPPPVPEEVIPEPLERPAEESEPSMESPDADDVEAAPAEEPLEDLEPVAAEAEPSDAATENPSEMADMLPDEQQPEEQPVDETPPDERPGAQATRQ